MKKNNVNLPVTIVYQLGYEFEGNIGCTYSALTPFLAIRLKPVSDSSFT